MRQIIPDKTFKAIIHTVQPNNYYLILRFLIGSEGAEIGIIMIPGANYPGERYIPLGNKNRWINNLTFMSFYLG